MLDLFSPAVEAPVTPAEPPFRAEAQPVRRWTEVVSIKGCPTINYHRAIWPNGVMTEEREVVGGPTQKKQSPTEVGLW